MKRCVAGIIAIFILFPGSAFAAPVVGASGSIETYEASVPNSSVIRFRANAYSALKGSTVIFEYGPTQAMEFRTRSVTVQPGKFTIVDISVGRLTRGVRYYYRPVLEGTQGVVRGEMKSAIIPMPPVASPTPPPASGSGSSGATGGNTSGTPTGESQSAAVGNSGASTEASGSSGETKAPASSLYDRLSQNPARFFQTLFDGATGAQPIALTLEQVPEKPDVREPVEYRVTLVNVSKEPVSSGTLIVTLPMSIAYLGDNSGGKMFVSTESGFQRLSMEVGAFKAGESKQVSIVSTVVGNRNGEEEQVDAEFLYRNKEGVFTRAGASLESDIPASSQVARVNKTESDGLLPNSLLEWILFVIIVLALIFGIRMASVYYEKKREALKKMEEEAEKKEQPFVAHTRPLSRS